MFNDVINLFFFQGELGLSNNINYKLFILLYLVFIYLFLCYWFTHLGVSKVFLTFIFLSSCVIVLSENLMAIFLGLEFQGFSILVLIGSNRDSLKNIESALKYFILGALFSGLYLLGLYFIYSTMLDLNLLSVSIFHNEIGINISIKLITLVVLFKLGAAPFYYWLVDVYESVSWPILGLLGSLPKISYLVVLYQLSDFNKPMLIISSLICIVVGVLGGFNQTKIKRLLAYSTINHTGLFLFILLLPNNINFSLLVFYYVIYTINFLGFIILLSRTKKNLDFLIDFMGLKLIQGVIGFGVLVLFLSLAGLPPLSGFFSKWFLILNLVNEGYIVLSYIVILSSILSIGYYLRLVKILYFQSGGDFEIWQNILIKESELSSKMWVSISLLLYFSMLFIINPSVFLLLLNYFIV